MQKITIILLCLLPFLATAQPFAKGRVIDAQNREAVPFALVKNLYNSEIRLTDKEGLFAITPGRDSIALQISGIGYQSEQVIIAQSQHLTIPLQRGAIHLKELVLFSGSSNNNTNNTISKIDLQVRPAKSAQELLRYVPGLFIAQHQGGGKAEQIFLRGYDIDHGTDISISVDGIPVNLVSHAHGQGYADLHFLIPELVKNIDHGKGPYYAMQGNLATAGYVQFETKNKLDKNLLQVETGLFNTQRALAMLQLLNKEKQDAYIAAELLYSDGPFERPQYFNRFNIQGRYNRQLGSRSLRYRYIQNRPANEDGSVVAKGYFVADAAISYTRLRYEAGIVVENIFNTRWNEAQFETTSRLRTEPAPVTELHFTPGMPFFIKARIAVFFS